MDSRSDDVNDLARRLAALSPASDGLDADRMLFAAGRASVRRDVAGWFWKAAAAVMLVLAGVLGAVALHERIERLALAERLDQRTKLLPAAPPLPSTVPSPEISAIEQPSANSVLASHQILTIGLDGLPVVPTSSLPLRLPSEQSPVLRARSSDGWPGL